MNRRALLAATATAGLSGCSNLLSGSESTPTAETTPTGEPTPSETATEPEPTETDQGLETVWRYETGGTIDAIDGGTVFCREAFHEAEGGGEGRVVALDAETGDLLWHYGFADGIVVYSTLTVEDGVYFGRGNDTPHGDGGVYALERDGTERWVEEETKSIDKRPRIADGTVYVGSEAGVAYAFDAETGDIHWKNEEIPSQPLPPTGVVAVGDVVYLRSHRLFGLDREDGEILWAVGNGDSTYGPQVEVANGTAYVYGNGEGGVTAVAPDGTERWRKNVGDGELEVCGGRAVVEPGPDSTTLYGLDAETGEEHWSVEEPGYDVAACTDDRLYAIGSNDGRLYAIDAADGTETWSDSIADDPLSGVWVIDENDSVFVETSDEENESGLHRLTPDGDVTWSVTFDGTVRSVVLEGDLYVGTSASVYRLPFE